MKKKYDITEEEFGAIKTAIENVLQLWHYDFIEANSENKDSTSMSKETFFDSLKMEFNVK